MRNLSDYAASSRWNNFSHLYIEREANEYPITRRIRDRFAKAQVVEIDDYKTVFARPRQRFQAQKESMKLILAVKKDRFLYAGSGNSQNFSLEDFHYNTLTFNCVYNCDYCYLQGMYPSANIVVFVNLEDYFNATRIGIHDRSNPTQPFYLCISYDTDLLAFESVVPYCRAWIEFAREEPDLLIEIRTKSAAYRAIRDLPPTDRVILAWTLSPEPVATRFEHGAAPLSRRLDAVRSAIDDGWPVRLCFDPVLAVPSWASLYGDLVEEVVRRIDPAAVRDVTVGVFRLSKSHFQRMKRQRRDTPLLYGEFEQEDTTVIYPADKREEMTAFMRQRLGYHFEEERIVTWM